MKKSILIIALVVCFSQSQSQITPFNKSFTKQQAKNWIVTNLTYVIVREITTQETPSFSFLDTSFIINIPHGAHIGNLLLPLNLMFSFKQIFVMNTNLTSKDGSVRTELLEFASDSLSVSCVVNINRLPIQKKKAFIEELTNAFYILSDKRDLIN